MKENELQSLDKKSILNLLSIFNEIGIDVEISENKLITNEIKKVNSVSKNSNENNKLTSPEKKALEISLQAKDINSLKELFENLNGCLLKKTATNFVPFEGNKNSKILIVDGSPESNEDKAGRPFAGERGILFEKMLQSINLKKEDVFITNAIPWRPPGNRYPTRDEINICKPFIFHLIFLLNPKIILCMGDVAINQILDLNKNITNSRGKWYNFDNIFLKKSFKDEKQIMVLPTHNVSYLLKRPETKRQAWDDLKLLQNKIKEII